MISIMNNQIITQFPRTFLNENIEHYKAKDSIDSNQKRNSKKISDQFNFLLR